MKIDRFRWSYGVLLYELFTGGHMPYHDVEVETLLEYLEDGGRLKRPDEMNEM